MGHKVVWVDLFQLQKWFWQVVHSLTCPNWHLTAQVFQLYSILS